MEQRVRYRTVLANREFAALFASFSLSLVGDQLARIALAVLVYSRTGSSLQASAVFGVSYLAYVAGGPVLSGLADRYSRLRMMVTCDVLRVPIVLLMCITDLPTPWLLGLVTLLGALSPAFDSARSSLQADVLHGEEYVAGNTLMGLTGQLSQVLGFALGGALVAATSSRVALLLDAATFLLSAGLLVYGVRDRGRPPVHVRPTGTGARQGLELVLDRRDLRSLIAFAVLGSTAVIGTEGLAVPVASQLNGGPLEAGVLISAAPLGYLIASSRVLRTAASERLRLLPRLVLISGVPLLASPFVPSVPVMWAVWVLAGIGGAVNLVAGPAYVQRVPPELRGRAYGVAATALQVGQGGGLLLAGVLADATSPRTAVALLAALTLLAATPLLAAQGTRELVRSTT